MLVPPSKLSWNDVWGQHRMLCLTHRREELTNRNDDSVQRPSRNRLLQEHLHPVHMLGIGAFFKHASAISIIGHSLVVVVVAHRVRRDRRWARREGWRQRVQMQNSHSGLNPSIMLCGLEWINESRERIDMAEIFSFFTSSKNAFSLLIRNFSIHRSP